VLSIITEAAWYVPNAVIKRDLKVLSVRQEVRNYSVTYRQRLDDHPNILEKSLFQITNPLKPDDPCMGRTAPLILMILVTLFNSLTTCFTLPE
jgi:hypothetical protein